MKTKLKISLFIPSPEYDRTSNYSDLAILQLNDCFQTSKLNGNEIIESIVPSTLPYLPTEKLHMYSKFQIVTKIKKYQIKIRLYDSA